MSDWKVVKLGEACEINMGQSPGSDSYNENKDGIPFYQGNADFGDLYPSVRYYCNKPTKIANKNDVLLSVRAPIGALNIATETCCIGRGLCAITEKENISYYKYLYYVLKFKNPELNSKGTGSTFKAINKTNLLNIEIPLPSFDKQKYIAAILDKTLEIINVHNEQLKELNDLIEATFYDMFGDPVSNEKGWEIKLCNELATKIGSGATPKGGNQSYKDFGISLIRSLNVFNGFFKYGDLAHIDEEQADKLKNVIVEKNDVLLNITGASVARSCIVPSDILPARVNQHVAIIRPIKDFLNSVFLNCLFTNKSYQQKLWKVATGNGATREAITKQQIESLEIILPPLEHQNKFAEIVSKVEEQKSIVKQSITESQNLFNSLMSKYFDE